MNDMDAQNAAGSDKPKPVAAAEKRPGSHQPDESKESTESNSKPAKAADESIKSPPHLPNDIKSSVIVSRAPLAADDAPADRDSDAETIVLPGKDGHSPSKVRKVKHEDRSDGEPPAPPPLRKIRDVSLSREADKEKMVNPPRLSETASSLGLKKKRIHDQSVRSKDGSSGLSSAPTSPPHHMRRTGGHSDTDTGADRRKSPKLSMKDRAKSTDRTIPHKRKAPRADSDDEAENRKARRQRIIADHNSSIESRANRLSKEPKSSSSSKREHDGHSGSRTRSVSPLHPRAHRRSVSTQLPANSSNGLSYKKKRLPPPLQSTDYHSDESSASGSPHPRSSKLRNLSTPATAESNMSPAKIAPHKKHLDAHGQTFLARACARGEYDLAKQRLGERPEDLNVADYAGNTPLQIAAINGYEDIVKLLIDAGCNLDCVNYDKDTPLLDAVDNGHLGVVKMLLNAGVNPRKANLSGEEPLDRVSDDLENAEEFRAALVEAKSRQGDRRRTSEDHHQTDHPDSRSSHGPDSPRRSPAPSSSHASGRRAGTVRANKTSNHLLYMSLDDKTLRQAAGKGDEETVTRILQVKDGCDDSEAMVAGARGGHEVVIQLLLALGGANPDPAPVSSMPPEFATPMLAAIGQENIKVVRLLLDQGNFDPTRRFKGETYYEIARRRQGTNWKEEEHMLKEAYDAYRKSHRDIAKTKSPSRREREKERERDRDRDRDREQDRETKRQGRNELKDEARPHKRNLSSPPRDPEKRKKLSTRNVTSPKEKRRADSFHDDQASPKRGPGRPRKEDRLPTIAVSDREASPALSQKQSAKSVKRAESDVAAMSSEGEAAKPRRKLVSKGELRGEREKNRRASMVSTASSIKDPSSPRDPKHDDHPEKPKGEPLSEKYHDRTKALKRDESRDRLSVSGDNSSKRHRSSVTPPHSSTGEKDDGEAPVKRRRLDVDGKERRPKSTASPDDPHRASRDGPPRSKSSLRDQEDSDRKPSKPKTDPDGHRRESGKSSNSDKSSIHVKSEDVDTEMPDASEVKDTIEADSRLKKDREDERRRLEEKERRRDEKRQEERKRREVEAEEVRKKEEERRQREAEEKKREAEQKKREAEQKKREAEQKQREAEEKRLREEEEAKQREEQERKRKIELEKKRQEEELRQRREAEDKKRREEEEKRLREEEDKKRREEELRRKEEEARKQREEEERVRKEQLEREAAEEARRLREEEERKERERKERLHREEMERKRAAKEAEQRRILEEQERLRLAKLPPLLRWLDSCPNPKTPELAAKFKHMQGVRYDTIRPQATGTAVGREQWVLNTHVALLLGEKDLALSRYTAWEHVPVSDLAKKVIWRLESDRYALINESLYELGAGLSDYYGEGQGPFKMSYRTKERLRSEAREKFLKLDMFFVKVSDLMFIVPSIPHLQSLKMSVEYRELPADESQLYGWKVSQKWKEDSDADRFYGFAPRNKYYINGIMVEEQKPGMSATSSTPFPEKRVPRKGLQQVFPCDPDYARVCKEQGLEHLLNGTKTPMALPNGGHLSPRSQSNATESSVEPSNGPQTLVSGPAPAPALAPVPAPLPSSTEPKLLPNGVNGVSILGSN